MEKLKFIDLFSGIGGIRLGLEQSFGKDNVECIFASEIDKFAIKSYQHNFKENNEIKNIYDINEKEIPDFDIALAGFPCQPFSKAGKELGFEDERGNLFFEIARILEEKKPSIVFLENVSRLKTHDNGDTFKVIVNKLESIGYKVYSKILNSKNFGLPQNRERIFFVCFLDHSINFDFPTGKNIKTKMSDILSEKVNDKYTLSDKMWTSMVSRKERNKKAGKGFGYRLFNHESLYGSTISARYGKDGSEVLIEQKDKNPRRLTPEEALKYQGFPKEFEIIVSDTQAYKQFGNSVSVPVIKEIFDNINKAIRKKEKKID